MPRASARGLFTIVVRTCASGTPGFGFHVFGGDARRAVRGELMLRRLFSKHNQAMPKREMAMAKRAVISAMTLSIISRLKYKPSFSAFKVSISIFPIAFYESTTGDTERTGTLQSSMGQGALADRSPFATFQCSPG
jgi:hypothetical protein